MKRSAPPRIQPRWVAASAAGTLLVGSLLTPALAGQPPAEDPITFVSLADVADANDRAVMTGRNLNRELPAVEEPPPVAAIAAPAAPAAPLTVVAADLTPSKLTSSGIPSVALKAYKRATKRINSADSQCHMRWELLAAIGRIESNHGRSGDSVMTVTGEAMPPVLGPVLDGAGPVALIRDTDGGLLDGDTEFDRAVGPMQFIPSTWVNIARDGDKDGKKNPHDIDDASLAAAAYLCAGKGDLRDAEDLAYNIYRYNRSDSYVQLVLKVMEAYGANPPRVVADSPVPPSPTPTPTVAAKSPAPASTPKPSPKPTASTSPKPSASSTPTPTVSSSPSSTPSEPTSSSSPTPTATPSVGESTP